MRMSAVSSMVVRAALLLVRLRRLGSNVGQHSHGHSTATHPRLHPVLLQPGIQDCSVAFTSTPPDKNLVQLALCLAGSLAFRGPQKVPTEHHPPLVASPPPLAGAITHLSRQDLDI